MEIIEADFEDGVLRPTRRLAATPEDEKLAEEGLGDWAPMLDRR